MWPAFELRSGTNGDGGRGAHGGHLRRLKIGLVLEETMVVVWLLVWLVMMERWGCFGGEPSGYGGAAEV